MSLGRIAVAGLGVTLVALGSAFAWGDLSGDQPTATSVQESTVSVPNRPDAVVGTTFHHYGRPAWKPGVPRRVVIEQLDMDAPVVPVSTVDNALTPPADPQQLGWWSAGAQTGARRGSGRRGGSAQSDHSTRWCRSEIQLASIPSSAPPISDAAARAGL